MFVQICASAVWVERLALSIAASLIFPAFTRLTLPHVGLSLSLVLARVRSSLFFLSSDGFRTLDFWKYSEYTCSLQAATSSKTTIKSDYKSVDTLSVLMRRVYACTGRM